MHGNPAVYRQQHSLFFGGAPFTGTA